MRYVPSLILAFLLSATCSSARADLLITFTETTTGDVLAEYSGSLDLAAFDFGPFPSISNNYGFIAGRPDGDYFHNETLPAGNGNVERYSTAAMGLLFTENFPQYVGPEGYGDHIALSVNNAFFGIEVPPGETGESLVGAFTIPSSSGLTADYLNSILATVYTSGGWIGAEPNLTPVPEPASLTLFCTLFSLLGVVFVGRRRFCEASAKGLVGGTHS